MQNLTGKAYSFIQASSKSMVHIDRIYIHKNLLNHVYNTEVVMGQETSDHNPVFIKIMENNLPYFGKGLWKQPTELLKTKNSKKCQSKS